MKPYGFKKKKPAGDGCFHCTQDRKKSKSSNRQLVRKQTREEMIQGLTERNGKSYEENESFVKAMEDMDKDGFGID